MEHRFAGADKVFGEIVFGEIVFGEIVFGEIVFREAVVRKLKFWKLLGVVLFLWMRGESREVTLQNDPPSLGGLHVIKWIAIILILV